MGIYSANITQDLTLASAPGNSCHAGGADHSEGRLTVYQNQKHPDLHLTLFPSTYCHSGGVDHSNKIRIRITKKYITQKSNTAPLRRYTSHT